MRSFTKLPSNDVYLDYNATAPIREEVKGVMREALDYVGNASSQHKNGQLHRHLVERSRQEIGELIGCDSNSLIFTSGGSEGNNFVMAQTPLSVTLTDSHPSLLHCSRHHIPIQTNGIIDLSQLERKLHELQNNHEKIFVGISAANSESGIIQPLRTTFQLVTQYNAHLHLDLCQYAPREDIRGIMECCHSIVLSSHKLGGPSGVGLVGCASSALRYSLIKGGGQERGWRSGTENTLGILGLATALEVTQKNLNDLDNIKLYRDLLESFVMKHRNDIIIVGREQLRIKNTSLMIIPNKLGKISLLSLDINGISVSSGSACSSGKTEASSVLLAMGYEPLLASSSLRISGGYASSSEDFMKTAKLLIAL